MDACPAQVGLPAALAGAAVMSPSQAGAKGLARRAGAHKRAKMKYAGQAKHVSALCAPACSDWCCEDRQNTDCWFKQACASMHVHASLTCTCKAGTWPRHTFAGHCKHVNPSNIHACWHTAKCDFAGQSSKHVITYMSMHADTYQRHRFPRKPSMRIPDMSLHVW